MFADPQSVTINAVAQSLPAISRSAEGSIYRKDDASITMSILHSFARRNRFTIRLDSKKTVSDPLQSTMNVIVSSSAYLVIDSPVVGYSNSELRDLALGLSGWATSANLLKVLGGET